MPSQSASADVSTLVLFVNGRKIEIQNPDPETTLVDFLRRKRLTGSKQGCGEGGCGVCTVMVSRYTPNEEFTEHFPVNSCLAPLVSLHGLAVTTVEGIGSVRGKLHPVQRLIAENHGSQCGFCTPGIVMSMYTLLRNNPQPTQKEIQETFDGNLCRCTGYRPILEGFKAFSVKSCSLGDNCCQNRGISDHEETNNSCENNDHECTSPLYDPSQELLFPPELKLLSEKLHKENLRFDSSRVKWLSPSSLPELLAVRRAYPDSKLVNGNTEIGIETKFKKITYPLLVSVARIPELFEVQYVEEGVKLGASLSLNRIAAELKRAIQQILPALKSSESVVPFRLNCCEGYGMLVLEQYKVTGQGTLLTSGPGTYKIPAFSNIPHVFNVTLLKNKGNPKAVYSSKGIGEPPQCLSIAVFLAIKSAISAARSDTGCSGYFQLDSPATPDRIRMSCIDQFSEKFLIDDEKDNENPWYVKL